MTEKETFRYISRSYTGTPEEIEVRKARDLAKRLAIQEELKDCNREELSVLAQAAHDRDRWDRKEAFMQSMRRLQEGENQDLAGAAWRKEQQLYKDRWHDN